MRISAPLLAVAAIAALTVTACQPNTSSSSGSGGGAPAPAPGPAPATSRDHGDRSGPTSTADGPLDNGAFDAVGDYQPGQRVNCDDINYPLMIRATGTVKWRAFATNRADALGRVIDEVHVEPSEGMLAPGQTATLNISGGITTIQPPPSYFYIMVEYVNVPRAGLYLEFDCQGR